MPEKDTKLILNLGHPRTGTGYMAKLYQAAGLDVQHEGIGEDGTSCWTFAVLDENWFTSWNGVRSDYNWKYITHNIRDPNDALCSICLTEDARNIKSKKFRRKYLDIDEEASRLSQSIQSFLGWNHLIKELNPDLKVKVEDCIERVEKFLKNKNLSDGIDRNLIPSSDYNSRKYSEISDKTKQKVPEGLKDKLNRWCSENDYSLYF